MKLFTVKLTDEERAALEAHRIRLGLRSHAETVRALIAVGPGGFADTSSGGTSSGSEKKGKK